MWKSSTQKWFLQDKLLLWYFPNDLYICMLYLPTSSPRCEIFILSWELQGFSKIIQPHPKNFLKVFFHFGQSEDSRRSSKHFPVPIPGCHQCISLENCRTGRITIINLDFSFLILWKCVSWGCNISNFHLLDKHFWSHTYSPMKCCNSLTDISLKNM